jgi:hypothetical protein
MNETLWSRVLEMQIVPELAKMFLTLYGIQMFITVYHWTYLV